MGDRLLMLDDGSAQTYHMNIVLKGRIPVLKEDLEWVETVAEATARLEVYPERYAALLVEPFLYSHRLEKVDELQRLMASARNDKHLPVIVYTTERRSVEDIYQLKQGEHYDAIVRKWGRSQRQSTGMIETLEKLLPQ